MRKQSIDGASIKDVGSERASADTCKQQMLTQSEQQQTHNTINESAGLERTQTNRQILKIHTHAWLLRESVNESM